VFLVNEIELLEVEFKKGVLEGVLRRDFKVLNKESFSLIFYNTSLKIKKNYVVKNICLEGENLRFRLDLTKVDFRELASNEKGRINLYIKSKKNKLYKLIVDQKHLKSKIKYSFSPNQLEEGKVIIPEVKKNHFSLKYDNYTNIIMAQKEDKKNIDNLKIDVLKKTISFKVLNCMGMDPDIKLVLIERQSRIEWSKELSYEKFRKNGYIQLDLTNFIQQYTQNSRWDAYIDYKLLGESRRSRLGTYHKEIMPKYKRYFNPYSTEGVTVVNPYLTDYNGLSLVIGNPNAVKSEKLNVKVKVVKFKMRQNMISGKVQVNLNNLSSTSIKSLILKYRSNIETIQYEFPIKETKQDESRRVIQFNIDVSKLLLENYYWDFYLELEIEGEQYLVRLRNPSIPVRLRVNQHLINQAFHYQNGFWVYPYITAVNTIALIYKEKVEHENLLYRFKERVALIFYLIFKLYFDHKNVWLVFEKFSESAQDNAFYFFKYCYDHHKDQKVYFIINKGSSDYKNVEPMKDRVLHYMSFKYMIYLFGARLLISSESKAHAYDIRAQKGLLKKAIEHKKQVFLQHGVLGLKKVDHIYKKTSRNAVDLFVVSSEHEEEIVRSKFGYNNNEIIITGLSRWDVLTDKSQGKSSILLMPTWRSWMDDLPEEKFIQTDYYQQYVALLNSENLFVLLEKYNIELDFFIHPKFKAYINHFNTNNNRIKILQYGDAKVNQLLMESRMLITDYSSVSWDMYYQHKPIVFYQFDLESYMKYQGSYIDMEKELFGDRVYKVDALIDLIEYYAKNNFLEKKEYAALRKEYLKYTDRNNSRRIYKEIVRRLKY
jgi:CDP-glycerol glycerophosphotransferase (TagB/SpsB family)